MLEGAAVAGDPFEPELAAAATAMSEAAAMDAIDESLRLDLVRDGDWTRLHVELPFHVLANGTPASPGGAAA